MKIHQAMISIPHPRKTLGFSAELEYGVQPAGGFLHTEECCICRGHSVTASKLQWSHLSGASSLSLFHEGLVT